MKLNRIKKWILPAAGVMALVISGLGFLYWRQVEQQHELSRKLAPQGVPAPIEINNLAFRKVDLQKEIDDATAQLEELRGVASRQIVSSNITRTLFDLAKMHNLEITELVASAPERRNLDGVDFSVMTLTIRAEGEDTSAVNFVIDLNGRFATGVIEKVEVTMPESQSSAKTKVYALMNLYTN